MKNELTIYSPWPKIVMWAKRSVVGCLILLFGFFVVSYFIEGTAREDMRQEKTVGEEVVEQREQVVVSTIGETDGFALAFVSIPSGGWIFQWEKDGKVVSDTFTGEDPLIGDIEMLDVPKGSVPVVILSGKRFPGDPL